MANFLVIVLVLASHYVSVLEGIDVTPPIVVGCPQDIRKDAPGNTYGTTVSWVEPTATDDFTDTVISYQSRSPGGFFYIGSTVVTYWFIDNAYNYAVCSFTVTVTSLVSPGFDITGDITPPVLRCPPDKKKSVASGTSTVKVEYEIEARDNSGNNVIINGYPPSGSPFSLGITVVRVIGTDASYNTGFCSFNVIVSEASDICSINRCAAGQECFRNADNTRYSCGCGNTLVPSVGGCTHPGRIDNGMIIPDISTQLYPRGSKVVFACNNGYLLEGATDIICTSDGTWSSALPRCVNEGQVKACGSPHTIKDIIAAVFGTIIGILVLEVIIFAACRSCKMRKDTKSAKPMSPVVSHNNRNDTTDISVTGRNPAPPKRPASLPQSLPHGIKSTNVTDSNGDPNKPTYQDLNMNSRDKEHPYMDMKRGSRAQLMHNQDDDDAVYSTPDYMEVLP